jgi:hypothetical protein
MTALDLDPPSRVTVDPNLRADVIDGRDLHEHWKENVPVLNVTPRVAQPGYPSGKSFATRHPETSPYWWLAWSSRPALGSCRTRLLPRCTNSSTKLKPRCSPPTLRSSGSSRHGPHHGGSATLANGGPVRPSVGTPLAVELIRPRSRFTS